MAVAHARPDARHHGPRRRPARRACTARPATSTSTPGGRSTAPSSRMRTPTMRASATATTSRTRDSEGIAAHAARRDIDLQTLAYGEAHRAPRRARVAASGRPRARLGAGAARTRRPGVGGLGRLQDRAPTAPARRSSRCAATPSSPNRPSACRSTAGRRRRELFADINAWWRATPTQGRASRAALLRLRQGAAHPARRRRQRSGRSWCTARSSR